MFLCAYVPGDDCLLIERNMRKSKEAGYGWQHCKFRTFRNISSSIGTFFKDTFASQPDKYSTSYSHSPISHSSIQQVVHGAFIEPAHRIRKRSINQQLRISLVYDLSMYRLDDDKFALVNVSQVRFFAYNFCSFPHRCCSRLDWISGIRLLRLTDMDAESDNSFYFLYRYRIWIARGLWKNMTMAQSRILIRTSLLIPNCYAHWWLPRT